MDSAEDAGATLRLSSPATSEGVACLFCSSLVVASLALEDWVGGAGGGGGETGSAECRKGLGRGTRASAGADGKGAGASVGRETGISIALGLGATGGAGRCAGGGGTLPIRMLGSRSSYGIFSSGGEDGCLIVWRLLSGCGGLEMMVSFGWKIVPPRAGGSSGRFPCPGFPPGPPGFNVGK